MKIIHVHNNHRYGGGSDVVAAQTAGLMRKAGHDVEEFVRDSGDLERSGKYGKIKAFISGIYNPGTIRSFEELLKSHQPDVVHAHEIYPMITPWIYPLCRKHGVTTVMTCHDYRITCPVYTHYRHGRICRSCIDRGSWSCFRYNCRDNIAESAAFAIHHAVGRKFRLFRSVDMFLTPSRFTQKWLVDNAELDKDRVRAVGNPIFPHDVDPKPYVPEEREYVAYGGRFAPEKGIDILLRATAIAGIPVKLAGHSRGYEKNNYGAQAEFVGPLNPAEMSDFYDGARFLVVPSTWFETFGLVVIEAMTRGVPVICSDIGALRELIEPEENGLLCEPGNVDEFAAGIKRLWDNPEECVRMSGKCRRSAAEYSPEKYRNNVLDAYGYALQSR